MLTKSVLVNLLKSKGITTRRWLGQNFLIDSNFLKFIIKTAQLSSEDYVLEIGSGLGVLTNLVGQNARYVWAVEIDKKLFQLSQSLYPSLPNVIWLNTSILNKNNERINPMVVKEIHKRLASRVLRPDALRWTSEDAPHPKASERQNLQRMTHNAQRITQPIKVISNLPYATSASIIMALVESKLPIKLMVLMTQWEMAERLTASPGSKSYNALSILVNLLATIKIVRKIPPDVFFPKPEVNSALITVLPKSAPITPTEYQSFKRFIQTIFHYRRKTISRALKYATNLSNPKINELLTQTRILPQKRPEEISPSDYLNLLQKMEEIDKIIH